MKPLILCDPYPRSLAQIFSDGDRARLEAIGEVLWHDGSPAPDEHIEKYLPQAVALIGQSALDKARLDRAPNLKIVANVESNFLPNVDYDECFRRGIHVVATSPVFAGAVAEMALGMALGCARGTHTGDAQMRCGSEVLYDEGANSNSFMLSGKTLGIVGMGNLGRALLPLLKPFGGKILAHDPWIHDSVLREMGVQSASAQEVFAQSKVVFILAATTSENAGAFGREHFDSMQQGSIVVLVSRAGVVDFDALLDACEGGHIRAAIDVFPDEPIPADARVRGTPNTLLSAHRAGNVPEVWPLMGEMVTDDIELVLRGLSPQRCARAVRETVSRLRSKPSEQTS
jgi:phosphoglycerate dehydrogenase-like enzyme